MYVGLDRNQNKSPPKSRIAHPLPVTLYTFVVTTSPRRFRHSRDLSGFSWAEKLREPAVRQGCSEEPMEKNPTIRRAAKSAGSKKAPCASNWETHVQEKERETGAGSVGELPLASAGRYVTYVA